MCKNDSSLTRSVDGGSSWVLGTHGFSSISVPPDVGEGRRPGLGNALVLLWLCGFERVPFPELFWELLLLLGGILGLDSIEVCMTPPSCLCFRLLLCFVGSCLSIYGRKKSILKFFVSFEQQDPHFQSALGLWRYVAGPVPTPSQSPLPLMQLRWVTREGWGRDRAEGTSGWWGHLPAGMQQGGVDFQRL